MQINKLAPSTNIHDVLSHSKAKHLVYPQAQEQLEYRYLWELGHNYNFMVLCSGEHKAPAIGIQPVLVQNLKPGKGPGLFAGKGDKHLIYRIQASLRKEKTTEQSL